MEGITFYKASMGNNIDNIDQRITQDIEQFATNISSLYATTFKPVVDIVLFTRRLASSVGLQGPAMMYLYYILSGFFLRRLLPNFARMTSKQQQLEGDFRFHHTRLLMHAEEIAFYRGWDREKFLINRSFDRLYSHCSNLLWKQALVGVFDAWLVKYGATMVGYAVVALPVFGSVSNDDEAKDTSAITRGYIRNTQILINLAQATGQIVLLYKRITQIAGYTSRVSELLELFAHVNRANLDGATRIDNSNTVKFENVDIVTPDEDLTLIRSINVEVPQFAHTIIMGPNGSGKSSVLRVLNQLWPAKSGSVSRPPLKDIMFIPQRPYFPLGTLRDQVIYPDQLSDMKRKGITDDDLLTILKDAELQYLLEREGGWDATKDWIDVLSGGEKQRMNISRVYYHKPKYACLDECTSAVSVDVEGRLYRKCQEYGCTIITISHRKQLMKYHRHLLKLDDKGMLNPSEIKEEKP
jgi:ATP-binding cassette subfamily D (ALD) protein 3